MKKWILLILLSSATTYGAGIPAVDMVTTTKGAQYSLSLQVMIFMTMLTLLPGVLMTMTSFTRIMIILAMLRQAIGLGQSPTNQILIGISLFLTLFIMKPVLHDIHQHAIAPLMEEKVDVQTAIMAAEKPLKGFMLRQVRQNDLDFFATLAGEEYETVEDVSFLVLMPAFLTSELKTAFQIGFLIFIPFLLIDIIVSSILMAMGMMMLSPLIISLPFKVLLFVLVDGWVLLLGSVSSSFG